MYPEPVRRWIEGPVMVVVVVELDFLHEIIKVAPTNNIARKAYVNFFIFVVVKNKYSNELAFILNANLRIKMSNTINISLLKNERNKCFTVDRIIRESLLVPFMMMQSSGHQIDQCPDSKCKSW
jgi:hypothetical protein